jgi:hypothetical protein
MGELTIRYKVWQANTVVSLGIVTAVCVGLVIYQPGAAPMLLGPVVVFVIGYLRTRALRLEVAPSVVRARQGGLRGRPDLEAPRGEVYEIHYCPRRIIFQGSFGRPVMEPYPFWTLEQVLQVADVLDVPVYDHRGRFSLREFAREELCAGRLVKGDSSAGW